MVRLSKSAINLKALYFLLCLCPILQGQTIDFRCTSYIHFGRNFDTCKTYLKLVDFVVLGPYGFDELQIR